CPVMSTILNEIRRSGYTLIKPVPLEFRDLKLHGLFPRDLPSTDVGASVPEALNSAKGIDAGHARR
ncbi:MAG: hypothetical protein MUQ00_02640, partial [Candidatus Aminicenantes bacterium]|nr:hypothetical protein [Candidatus Aminicenantes bacterium]